MEKEKNSTHRHAETLWSILAKTGSLVFAARYSLHPYTDFYIKKNLKRRRSAQECASLRSSLPQLIFKSVNFRKTALKRQGQNQDHAQDQPPYQIQDHELHFGTKA